MLRFLHYYYFSFSASLCEIKLTPSHKCARKYWFVPLAVTPNALFDVVHSVCVQVPLAAYAVLSSSGARVIVGTGAAGTVLASALTNRTNVVANR